MSIMSLVAFLVTFGVFAAAGWLLGGLFKQPVRVATWVVVAAVTLAAAYIGRGTMLLSVFGFNVHLGWALVSLGGGTIVSMLYRAPSRTQPLGRPFVG